MPSDFEMMKSPDRWPMWPRLPLKNRKEGNGSWPKMGFLLNPSPTDDTLLYFAEGKLAFEAVKREELEKIESEDRLKELIDQGWVVD